MEAIWLVRSYLALAAAGVDRAAMFMFRDTKSDGGGVFETSGMVTEKGKWAPKPSYMYIGTLKHRLAGYRFAVEVDSGRKNVLIYRFSGVDKNGQPSSAYAVWCPSSEDRTVTNVKLTIGAPRATKVDFGTNTMVGNSEVLAPENGMITLDVTEKPSLIFVP